MFYLDDGTLGGCLKDIVEDLHGLEGTANALGLHFNQSKSEIICTDIDTRQSMLSFFLALHPVDPPNATLLGSPIGNIHSIDSAITTKIESLKMLGNRLQLLHAHDALCLPRNAFTLPKVLYLICAAP